VGRRGRGGGTSRLLASVGPDAGLDLTTPGIMT